MTHDDVCDGFPGRTLLAVQGPNGTQLEVPRPEFSNVPGRNISTRRTVEVESLTLQNAISGQKIRYQIHLKSTEGQIYVLLVNKDQDSDQPVVMQVKLEVQEKLHYL